MTVLLPAGSLLVAGAAASPALTSKKSPPPPPPIQLLCAPTLMGAALVNGVCALPNPSLAGVASDHIQPLAVSNRGGRDTLKVICGTVPPRLSVLPQRECMIAFGDAPRPGRSCSGSRPPARQGAMVTHACSITWLTPGRGLESAGHGRAGPAHRPRGDQQPWRDRWLWRPDVPRRDRAEPQQPDPAWLQQPDPAWLRVHPGNATAINDSGQIAASGYHSVSREHAFPADPQLRQREG
jgi:hypothetical protein